MNLRVILCGSFIALLISSVSAGNESQEQQLARTFIQQLADEQFAEAAKHFDETMKGLVAPADLRKVWQRETARTGAFTAIDELRFGSIDERTVVEAICAMERSRIVVRITIDKDQHIAGLFFRAAPAPVDPATAIHLETPTGKLYGSIDLPEGPGPFPVLLVIAGSGPTDRDGNSGPLKNNSLKLLGKELAKEGIAVVRYDKRGIGESTLAAMKEEQLSVPLLAADAAAWIAQLRCDNRFCSVGVLGHSEGALMATLAGQQQPLDYLVLVAGAGRPAADLLREQLSTKLTKSQLQENERILEQLAKGETVEQIPPLLAPLYRPSVQPYLISWLAIDPAHELAKITAPVLILQGTKDIQVSVRDAELLAKAQPQARLVIVLGMNHVLKTVHVSAEQQITYWFGWHNLAKQLVPSIAGFVKEHAVKD